MMLLLHLFSTDYRGLFQPIVFIDNQPLSYYFAIFSDACVPVFAFVSGYGLYFAYKTNPQEYVKKNRVRLKKLYLRYWVIILLFVLFLGWIVGKPGYPGPWLKLLLSATAMEPAYNGAWWYLTIYIAFIFTSKFWFQLLDKNNSIVVFGIMLLIYIIAFYFRTYSTLFFENVFLQWSYSQSVSYFFTLFQFFLGVFALKFNWHGKVSTIFKQLRYKEVVAILSILSLIVFHGTVPNLIIAPLTGLVFILLFLELKLPNFLNKLLDLLTPHSTNIWLIHMFFCQIYFKDLIYWPQLPFFIFLWLTLWCILSSYFLNVIYTRAEKILG